MASISESSISEQGVQTVTAAAHFDGPPSTMAIIVVNYAAHELIDANLDDEAIGDAVVVIVDNASTDEERRAVAALAERRGWALVAQPGNPGFGAGVNAGVARAGQLGCDAYLILNPDARVSAAVVAQLHASVVADPMALVSPRIVTSAGHVEYNGSRVFLADGRIRGLVPRDAVEPAVLRLDAAGGVLPAGEQGWLPGACLAVHRELWELVGGFDETLFLYWEDVDLSARVEAAGGRLVLRRDLEVVHDEGGTQARSGRAKSPAYYRYNTRNRLAFAASHLPRRQVAAWMLRTPAVSWEILMRGGRRQLIESPRPALAALAGSVAGLWLAARRALNDRAAQPGAATGDSPVRSVLVAHPGAELYGSDRVMLESVSALVEAGCHVTVAVPEDGPLTSAVRERGADVVLCAMPVVRKSALRPRGFLRLVGDAARGLPPAVRLVHRAGRDGVYVSTITVPSWLVLARLLGRPVTCHVHEAERSVHPILRRLIALPTRAADTIIVNSRFSLGVLLDSAPAVADRCTVVYNAVEGPVEFRPARAEIAGPIRLLFVGRLSPRKGPQVALAALTLLRERGVDAELGLLGSVFAGYEWFERELRDTVVGAGLTDRVTFHGFENDIWPRLADADVILVPSVVDEPFGNTAVEAVLAARPLIVSTTSGLLEAAAGYGSAQATDPTRPEEWADAVERVLADWTGFAARAEDDAVTARLRHSPQRYRDEVARLILRERS